MRIFICDENVRFIEDLENKIKQIDSLAEVRTFTNEFGLNLYLETTKKNLPDVIILSAYVGNVNCINFAKKINIRMPSIPIAFMSWDASDAEKIFHANPAYFFINPISIERLRKMFAKIEFLTTLKKGDILSIDICGTPLQVDLSKLDYVESQGRVVRFYEQNFVKKAYLKLDEVEQLLPSTMIRTHQSYIVNIKRVSKVEGGCVIIGEGKSLPVSRVRYATVKEKYAEYLSNYLSDTWKLLENEMNSENNENVEAE